MQVPNGDNKRVLNRFSNAPVPLTGLLRGQYSAVKPKLKNKHGVDSNKTIIAIKSRKENKRLFSFRKYSIDFFLCFL